MTAPIAAVGIVCIRDRQVLLVKRGKAPMAGRWSVPGGRIEPGESAAEAALRELAEEASVEAELLGVIEDFPLGGYLVTQFAARWIAGAPRAGDDAVEACFVRLDQLDPYALTADLRRVIAAGAALAAHAASAAPG